MPLQNFDFWVSSLITDIMYIYTNEVGPGLPQGMLSRSCAFSEMMDNKDIFFIFPELID